MCALRARDQRGQMAVELAVLMPVVIVVALVVYNLARYVRLCAVFDRVAPNAVLVHGASPSGSGTGMAAVDEVRDDVRRALDAGDACSVEVGVERMGSSGSSALFSLSSTLVRYRCVLVFRPWPSSFVIAGVPYKSPLALRHERSVVVDRCGGEW